MDATIRPEWLFEISNHLQAGVWSQSGHEGARLIEPASQALLAPVTPFEVQVEAALRAAPRETLQQQLLPRPQGGEFHWHGESPSRHRVHDAVRRAAELLRAEYARPWTLELLARRVGCNRTQLEAGFKIACSCSYRRVLTHRRIRAAEELLATTQWRVEEVGKSVGFSSKASFYFNFKRHVGLTPERYRLRWRAVPAPPSVVELLNLNRD